MTTYEIPQVRKFRPGSLTFQASRIVTRKRRFHSWFRGWRDGRRSLNGRGSAEELTNGSHFLRKVRSHADSLQADCEGKLRTESIRLTELDQKLRERLESISQTIREMEKNAEGLTCERPTATRRSYIYLLIFLFVAEVAFSYLNLMYADMGGFFVEGILSLVFAGCLVGLSHTIGQRYRRLPLSPTAPHSASVKIYSEIAFFCIAIVGVLSALTYLRSRGLRLRGEDGGGELTVEIALFIIGFGFLGYAAWVAGQVEYSGPKYGAAALEQKKRLATDLLVSVDGETRKVAAFGDTLHDMFSKNKERIDNIYIDQYRRHERPLST